MVFRHLQIDCVRYLKDFFTSLAKVMDTCEKSTPGMLDLVLTNLCELVLIMKSYVIDHYDGLIHFILKYWDWSVSINISILKLLDHIYTAEKSYFKHFLKRIIGKILTSLNERDCLDKIMDSFVLFNYSIEPYLNIIIPSIVFYLVILMSG